MNKLKERVGLTKRECLLCVKQGYPIGVPIGLKRKQGYDGVLFVKVEIVKGKCNGRCNRSKK